MKVKKMEPLNLDAQSNKELEKFRGIANKVMALDEDMSKLTDEELKDKTTQFKDRLSKGETLDDIMVEAFATAREAAFRVIGEKPYFVQIVGKKKRKCFKQ